MPSCKLAIKALPNAPRNEIIGWLGEALKIKVHAPPLAGRANKELCRFVAAELGLPPRAVRVANGDKSRLKILTIDGLTIAEVTERLNSRRVNP